MTTAEDICHGVPREKLDSPITDIHIADLAFMLTTWEELAPYIGLTPAEEEAIQVDYQGRYGLQKRQALRKWKSKLGSGPNGATYRQLIIALCRALDKEIAEKVRGLLTEPEESADSASTHVLDTFRKYLVDCYTIIQHPSQTQWPFSRLSSYIDLTLVQAPDTQMSQFGHQANAQPLREVQLRELFHVGSHQAKRKVVLIEGPAGCGKTTLSWHVCREWAAGRLFQQFSLVVHVSLAGLDVLSAKCLPDIIPHESSEMRKSVAEAISEQDGKGVCFLFDAWDEAPRALRERSSYLFKFVTGVSTRMLPHCSIIVTSRPVASGLLYPQRTTCVNIRGFGATKLEEFIAASLQDRSSKRKLLRLLKEKPQVSDLCNLPINAAIVVHLFSSFYYTLPSTRTGLFKALACNLLLRHMQLRTKHGLQQEVEEFERLPADVRHKFRSVCRLAFEGVMEERKVFLRDSLRQLGLTDPSSPLGLMQAQQQLTGFGPRHCYSFLHYAVHEFLAAYHITKLSEKKQTEVVGQILHRTPLSTVLPFYAGLTGLSNRNICDSLLGVTKHSVGTYAATTALRDSPNESSDRRRLLLALLNCIYESQKWSICNEVNPPTHSVESEIIKQGIPAAMPSFPGPPTIWRARHKAMHKAMQYAFMTIPTCYISFACLGLDPTDCISIGYFIANKCCVSKVIMDVQQCCISDTEVDILLHYTRKVRSREPTVYLQLDYNFMSETAIKCLSDTLIQSSALMGISLTGCWHPAVTDIKSALKYLIEGVSRNSSLITLALEECSLGPAYRYYLALLVAVSKTTIIDLSSNNIRLAIPFIAEVIKYNKTMKELKLLNCYISDKELRLLGNALQQNNTVTLLVIKVNPFSSNGLTTFLEGFIGSNSRLCKLTVNNLSYKQRLIVAKINATRLLNKDQFCMPLEVDSMSFAFERGTEMVATLSTVPSDLRTRSEFKTEETSIPLRHRP